MFSPPVIAFQIAIAAIVLVGAYFGGKIVFIIAIILAVGWTLTMLGGPLVMVQLGTVVLAAWAGFHFFFSKPDTVVREGADRPVARVERQIPAPHRDIPARQAVVSQPRLPTETTAAVQEQPAPYAAAPSTPPPAVQPREVSTQAAPARTVQEQPPAPQLSFNSKPLRLGQKYSDKQLERMFDFDYKEVSVMQAMMHNARTRYLAADSSKFGRPALVRMGDITEFDALFTDSPIDDALAKKLEDAGVECVFASRELEG